MNNDDLAATANREGWVSKLLTFRGSISKGKYFLGLIGEIGILFIGLLALAGLNNPTGAGPGAVFFAAVFPLLALYLHMCLVAARMRDVGVAYPVALGVILAILPFAWVVLTLEWIESLWVLMLIVFLLLYFGPVFPKSKAATAPQS